MFIHGDSHTQLHNKWSGMLSRCYNKSERHYKWYGKRGINVCDEWRENYLAFKDWAYANGFEPSLTLDRIDNDKGYSPENCRWVSMKIQNNNNSHNHMVDAFGEKKTLAQWAEKTGIAAATIRKRLKIGWDAETALTKEVRKGYPKAKVKA